MEILTPFANKGIKCFTISSMILGTWINFLDFFFLFKRAFILNQNGETCYWKYWPSLVITFRHFSDDLQIPLRKVFSSFEAMHESTDFSMSSKSINQAFQGTFSLHDKALFNVSRFQLVRHPMSLSLDKTHRL